MKKFLSNFVHNGLVASGFGSIVWVIVYSILHRCGVVGENISLEKTLIEIVLVSLLAFIAGGLNSIYKIEKLSLATAILIHATALYLSYTIVYLVNGWIKSEIIPFLVFTLIFAVGYAITWLFIYLLTKKTADSINARLAEIQTSESEISHTQ